MSAYDAHLYNQPGLGPVPGSGSLGGNSRGGSYNAGDFPRPGGAYGGDATRSSPVHGQMPGSDPRYDPARAVAMRAFGGGPGGRPPHPGGNDEMTPDQLDSLRRLTGASRQETCTYVLYVQRNRETGQLDLPSRFAWMDAAEHDSEFALVDVADIDPRNFPTWLDRTPLLVVRRRDGHYIWKGQKAIQYLEKMSRSSIVGVPSSATSAVGSYMPATYRDPRYSSGNNKITDTGVDTIRSLREKQDKLAAARLRRPAGRAGHEPRLPSLDPKTPLSEDTLFAMGKHPSQIERQREAFELRKHKTLQENPGRALQSGY